jgi:hypothetical protein
MPATAIHDDFGPTFFRLRRERRAGRRHGRGCAARDDAAGSCERGFDGLGGGGVTGLLGFRELVGYARVIARAAAG